MDRFQQFRTCVSAAQPAAEAPAAAHTTPRASADSIRAALAAASSISEVVHRAGKVAATCGQSAATTPASRRAGRTSAQQQQIIQRLSAQLEQQCGRLEQLERALAPVQGTAGGQHALVVVRGVQQQAARVVASISSQLQQQAAALRTQSSRRKVSGLLGVQANSSGAGSSEFGRPLDMAVPMPARAPATAATTASGTSSQGFRNPGFTAHAPPSVKDVAEFFDLEAQQQLSVTGPSQHLVERHRDVSTMHESMQQLGSLFGRLSHLVSVQQEAVQRLDDNVAASAARIDQAQEQLQAYWETVSSNQRLAIQVTAVLLLFALIFTVFFV